MRTVKKEHITVDWKSVAEKIAADKKIINEHLEKGGKLRELDQFRFVIPSQISV